MDHGGTITIDPDASRGCRVRVVPRVALRLPCRPPPPRPTCCAPSSTPCSGWKVQLLRSIDFRSIVGSPALRWKSPDTCRGAWSGRSRVGDLAVHAVYGLDDAEYEPVRYQFGEGPIGLILEENARRRCAPSATTRASSTALASTNADRPSSPCRSTSAAPLQGVLAVQPDAPDDGLLAERARFVEMVANLIGQSVRLPRRRTGKEEHRRGT